MIIAKSIKYIIYKKKIYIYVMSKKWKFYYKYFFSNENINRIYKISQSITIIKV